MSKRANLEAALFLFVVGAALLAPVALAQDGGVAVPEAVAAASWWSGLLNSQLFMWLGGAALSALGGLKWLSVQRKKDFAIMVRHAFFCAEDLGNNHEGPDAFDKMAAALKALDGFLVAAGWGPAKPEQVEQAKLLLSSMHGETVAAREFVKSP